MFVQVEEGTPFDRWYGGKQEGQSLLPPEPAAVAMFEAASATLTAAGYEHYEVRQAAAAGWLRVFVGPNLWVATAWQPDPAQHSQDSLYSTALFLSACCSTFGGRLNRRHP
jgi:coproporphyrinogen III oxidase-like Fe-S oxidoreductase